MFTEEGGIMFASMILGAIVWYFLFNWVTEKMWGKGNEEQPGWYYFLSFLFYIAIVSLLNLVFSA